MILTRRQLLVAAILLLTLAQCLLLFVVAALTWDLRALLGPPPAQIEENARLALAEFAALGLNLAGVISFSARSRGFGGWLLAGILVCDLAWSLLLATVFEPPGWLVESAAAAATLFLLYPLVSGRVR
jgi:hypothetical protein